MDRKGGYFEIVREAAMSAAQAPVRWASWHNQEGNQETRKHREGRGGIQDDSNQVPFGNCRRTQQGYPTLCPLCWTHPPAPQFLVRGFMRHAEGQVRTDIELVEEKAFAKLMVARIEGAYIRYQFRKIPLRCGSQSLSVCARTYHPSQPLQLLPPSPPPLSCLAACVHLPPLHTSPLIASPANE